MAAAQHSRPCDEEIRDAIVIGGGPAGLSAALVLGRCLRRVLICDAGHPRNEPARIFNGFLSRDGSNPAEFLQICRDQLRRYDTIEFRKVKVMDVERGDCRFTAILETGERVASRMLLLATGLVDELPQIFNVLKGDMGMVGPRPEVPEFVEPGNRLWDLVLSVRPGITDVATLLYRNEEQLLASSAQPELDYHHTILPAKLALNIEYMRSRSLRRDIRLLLLTAWYSLRPGRFHGHQVETLLRG